MDAIPKIIHYCWFGGSEKSELIKLCVDSWKKYMPDYKYIEWNEENFDINCSVYAQQAYERKKYAFVADYARVHILYHYGGIYIDTDTELIKSLDALLENEAFLGFENIRAGKLAWHLSAGIIGAKKNHRIMKEFLEHYDKRVFISENGEEDLTPIVLTLANLCQKYGLDAEDRLQVLNGLTIYPSTFFAPIDFGFREQRFSENTHCIHYFDASWVKEKRANFREYMLTKSRLSRCMLQAYNKVVVICGTEYNIKQLLAAYGRYVGQIKSGILFATTDVELNELAGIPVISLDDINKLEIDELIISGDEPGLREKLVDLTPNSVIWNCEPRYDSFAENDVLEAVAKHTSFHQYFGL